MVLAWGEGRFLYGAGSFVNKVRLVLDWLSRRIPAAAFVQKLIYRYRPETANNFIPVLKTHPYAEVPSHNPTNTATHTSCQYPF